MSEISLKEYLEALLTEQDKRNGQRFEAQEKAVQAALTAAKEAVVKAEVAAEKRFDNVNEFRQTLSDQTNTFIPRAEANIKFDGFDKAIDELKNSGERRAGRSSGLNAGWGYLVAGIGVISVIITLIITLRK